MRRILSHKIISDGQLHSLSVVTIDDNGRLVSIEPFERETEATEFISGTIILSLDAAGRVIVGRKEGGI